MRDRAREPYERVFRGDIWDNDGYWRHWDSSFFSGFLGFLLW